MKIHIFDRGNAEIFVPNNSTYCICIGNSNGRDTARPYLSEHQLCHVEEYRFDDTWPGDGCRFNGDIIFDSEISRRLLCDFKINYSLGDDLLVHCTAGLCRSPAVGLALNKLFRLDWSRQMSLLEKFPGFNRWVYKTIIKSETGL